MSLPFYQARPGEPMGVRRRRRFGFSHGRLTAYEDEELTEPRCRRRASEILESEIERPRTGPMRDIVATIQPEQDIIVRAGLGQSLCVQGAPGTGKTAVGLHRAAYLLYAFRDQLARSGVLVVGPNDSFLSYIGDVLPGARRDRRDPGHRGVAGQPRPAASPSAGVDPVPAALVKGDARMAEVLHRAVWGHLRPRRRDRWSCRAARTSGGSAATWPTRWSPSCATAGSATRPAGRCCRSGWPTRCCCGWRRAGDSPDDRVQNAVARSKPVRAYADALWPALDPAKLVLRLLTDAEFLARGGRRHPDRPTSSS